MTAKWLNFVRIQSETKTQIWSVRAKQGGEELGQVKWYTGWRKYCFYPGNALFEWDCLRDIAEFCETQTLAHKRMPEADGPAFLAR